MSDKACQHIAKVPPEYRTRSYTLLHIEAIEGDFVPHPRARVRLCSICANALLDWHAFPLFDIDPNES